MEDIVIIGAGRQSAVVIDVIEKQGKYRIIGLIDSGKEVGQAVYGYEVLGREDTLRSLPVYGGIIAVGDNWTRSRIAARIQALRPDFRYVAAVSPYTDIARGATIGDGTVIYALSTISANASLGRHGMFGTHACIGHDNHIGDFVNVHSNATLCGSVTVGSYATIGASATVLQNVSIGEHTVIGAGSIVTKDIGPNVIAYGSPCKVVRERPAGEKYL